MQKSKEKKFITSTSTYTTNTYHQHIVLSSSTPRLVGAFQIFRYKMLQITQKMSYITHSQQSQCFGTRVRDPIHLCDPHGQHKRH